VQIQGICWVNVRMKWVADFLFETTVTHFDKQEITPYCLEEKVCDQFLFLPP
jgi:hypothetical protein